MTSTAEARDMGNEALLDEYESATARHRSDHGDCTDADDFDVLRAELLRRLSAGNPQAEKVRATKIIRALVYAGDKCRGHRDCAHSMQPWQDARSYLADVDGEPLQEPERSDGQVNQRSTAEPCDGYSGKLAGDYPCTECGWLWSDHQ